ncbi:MAG: hypothetical protein KAX65_06415, partial [Caldilineaceae bacterium]|nr:hypothetical protein [Caldilineaceae bacterium]
NTNKMVSGRRRPFTPPEFAAIVYVSFHIVSIRKFLRTSARIRNRLKSNHKDTKDTKMHYETRRSVIVKRFFVPLCALRVFVVRLFKQSLRTVTGRRNQSPKKVSRQLCPNRGQDSVIVAGQAQSQNDAGVTFTRIC